MRACRRLRFAISTTPSGRLHDGLGRQPATRAIVPNRDAPYGKALPIVLRMGLELETEQ